MSFLTCVTRSSFADVNAITKIGIVNKQFDKFWQESVGKCEFQYSISYKSNRFLDILPGPQHWTDWSCHPYILKGLKSSVLLMCTWQKTPVFGLTNILENIFVWLRLLDQIWYRKLVSQECYSRGGKEKKVLYTRLTIPLGKVPSEQFIKAPLGEFVICDVGVYK